MEVDFETVNPQEEENFLERDTEKCEFEMKLRPRSPPQANLFQNINKKNGLFNISGWIGVALNH